MRMPSFTAEASLYQTIRCYQLRTAQTDDAVGRVIPAQRGITSFSAGGSRQCRPDTTGDCPQTGFEIYIDGSPTGDCCTPSPPPPPPTQAQCNQNYAECWGGCWSNPFTPFPFNIPCLHDCDTALCDCLIATGDFPPGTVLNCGPF